MVTIGLILFSFSTIIAWAYYGEVLANISLGALGDPFFAYSLPWSFIPGAALKTETAWHLADISNGLMVVPNLIALVALSKVIVAETNSFLAGVRREEELTLLPREELGV